MYTREEAELTFIGFQPILIGEQSRLVQFIKTTPSINLTVTSTIEVLTFTPEVLSYMANLL